MLFDLWSLALHFLYFWFTLRYVQDNPVTDGRGTNWKSVALLVGAVVCLLSLATFALDFIAD